MIIFNKPCNLRGRPPQSGRPSPFELDRGTVLLSSFGKLDRGTVLLSSSDGSASQPPTRLASEALRHDSANVGEGAYVARVWEEMAYIPYIKGSIRNRSLQPISDHLIKYLIGFFIFLYKKYYIAK